MSRSSGGSPIGDHALLSDCQTAALVTADGTLDWWPGPRFDSPSVFSSLLDERAGHWTIQPVERFDVSRRYLPATLVLETTMRTSGGALRLLDCLAFASGARGHEIGLDSPHAAVRVAEALDGDIRLRFECVPRPEYGLVIPTMVARDGGVESVGGPERLFLSGDRPLTAQGSRAGAEVTLASGERAGWVLPRLLGTRAERPKRLDPHAVMEDTAAAWRSWSELHDGYQGEYRDAVLHSALVVQALTYQPSGAVVAAPTTSLPEVLGGDSNWDYRFAWLRDASLIARGLSIATCADEPRRYFEWMTRAAVSCRHSDHVQIVFGVEGERNLSEHELGHLRGHRGSRPVRIGNAAWSQKQLDVLGEILDSAWLLRDELGSLEPFTAAFLCQLVDRAAEQWPEADASIWEGREGERNYLVSKLMCWVALDRGVRLAMQLGPSADATRWAAARDAVRDAILRRGWSDDIGAFAGAFDSNRLDVGVLIMPMFGFLSPGDSRVEATVHMLERELGDDGLLRRWTGAEDGAFLLASFWLSECHARAGRVERAQDVFERAYAQGNDLGLLAEEVDPSSGELLGNFPQAFAHIGLITAAQAITDARRPATGSSR